jgi:hypothetical protein
MNQKKTLPFRPRTLTLVSTKHEAERILNELESATADLAAHGRVQRPALEKTIWRAGEMRLTAAAPALIHLIGSGNAWRDYCIAWSLGWLNHESAVLPLARITEDALRPPYVRHIAREALMKLFDDSIKASFHQAVLRQLPSCLRELAARGSTTGFTTVLLAYLAEEAAGDASIFDLLYQLNTERVRPGLLTALRQVEINDAFPELMKRFYASALYRRDAEMLGLIAGRLEQAGSTEYAARCQALSKRIWQTLQKLGQNGETNFANQVMQYRLNGSVRFTQWAAGKLAA